MIINDFSELNAKRSLNYAEKTPAVILKTGEDNKKDGVFGVFIPRLMYGLPISKGAYEKTLTLDTSKILNTKNKSIGSKTIKVKNYATLPVAVIPNAATPRFTYGENVFVDMADKDLKSLFILPYSLGDVNRRVKDMYTIMCPNFKKPGESFEQDNTYGIQIDTINQIIGLWTSNNNGEKSKYTFAINAKDGKILLSDNAKRMISISTENDTIEMKNEKGSSIKMSGAQIDINCETLNVNVKNDINVKSSSLKRKIDKISTESSEDIEKIDKYEIKGNEFKGTYNKQSWKGSSYENKTSKWKVDSPISGFTKALTADSFSIWSTAGMQPLPTCANINSSGIAAFGNPSLISLPLVKAQPLMMALSAITAVLDTVGCLAFIPPTLSATVSAMSSSIMTTNVKG